ncbi:MAG: hypothetical protein HY824_01660 [Acidobacteria bacterium]|nr:hypothetical protein [Acidobacteriota bacterium]
MTHHPMTRFITRFAAAAVVLLTLQIVGHGQTGTAPDLRTRLRDRFDVVALQQGIALVPRQAGSSVRMVQIVDGVVTVDGDTVTGRQLRDRIGADADLVLQASYLSGPQQQELASNAPAAPVPAPQAGDTIQRTEIRRGGILRFGRDITVGRNERIDGDVVSFGGDVDIQGEVTEDVLTFGGSLTLGPDAIVRGDLTAVGGPFTRAPGARVLGDVNEMGGEGRGFRGRRPFPGMFFGTFWSRLGGLAATVMRLSLLVLFGIIAVAFGRGWLERVASRTSAGPLRAGLVGLLAEILFVPVMILTVVVLAVSIVGIPLLALVPFGILLLVLVMVVGFLGLAYQIGGALTSRFGWTERGAYAAVAFGVVAIGALTLLGRLAGLGGGFFIAVPLRVVGFVVEYVAWTVGFGAAILAWYERRQES